MRLIIIFALLNIFFAFNIKASENDSIKSFTVGGVKVICLKTQSDVISARLFIRGGVSNYPKAKEGIEELALLAIADCGTQTLPVKEYIRNLEELGTTVSGATNRDYGSLSMRCIKSNWEQSWKLFTDAILEPRFDKHQFELIKTRLIQGSAVFESNPASYVSEFAFSNAFQGQSYGNNPKGSPERISALNLEEVKTYYQGLLTKSQIFLVVVGNVEVKALIDKVKQSFVSLPVGNYKEISFNSLTLEKPDVKSEYRKLATNYLFGFVPAPDINSVDYASYRLAMGFLAGSVYNEIRTERGLAYSPNVYVPFSRLGYGIISVSTNDPNKTVKLISRTISESKGKYYSSENLELFKNKILTATYQSQESAQSQSSWIGECEIDFHDWRKSILFYSEDIVSVQPRQIANVLEKYLKNISWFYLGDDRLIDTRYFLRKL